MSQSNQEARVVGLHHNNPPTPFEECQAETAKWYEEAKIWLDGEKVEDEKTADIVQTLLKSLKNTRLANEKQRKADKEPHLEAGRVVDGQYNDLKEMVTRAENACKAALAPYLAEIERQKEEEARKAREEAERKRQEELAAHQQKDRSNLDELEAAEDVSKEAKKADKAAAKLEKEATKSAFKSVKRAVVTDWTAAARHYWTTDGEAFRELIQKLADRDVRHGATSINGVTIEEEKVMK